MSNQGGSIGFLSILSFVLIIQSYFFVANSTRTKSHLFANLFTRNLNSVGNDEVMTNGTKWAVLVAGSTGWWNYRHQADVCHAYQILKRSGMKDENIVVFMYDDIAYNTENPTPGVIINKPNGTDVYHGVPKDYTGENMTVNNLFAAILGNTSAITGGSGKVVNSGPEDYIFIYYTDHGGSGVIEMPDQPLYAVDLIKVLKTKHEANAYKSMVFYLEACESGSMFEGLLPPNISIYATTAANATEDSWAEYCPADGDTSPLDTCLGDLYSISWLEDCDVKDPRNETFQQQYVSVRDRTLKGTSFNGSSHVQQYGDMSLTGEFLSIYFGDSAPSGSEFGDSAPSGSEFGDKPSGFVSVQQRDADLHHYQQKVRRSAVGSLEYTEAKKKLSEEIALRERVDFTVGRVGELFFGTRDGSKLSDTRPAGQPVVDDWDCLKTFVSTYEKYCGSLSTYGLKYMRHFANMCNHGLTPDLMVAASIKACS